VSVDWPELEELKKLLDVEDQASGEGDWDEHLELLLEAGISAVKEDTSWDEATSVVTEKLHHAALRAAILLRPNAPLSQPGGARHQDLESDPVYQSLIMGKRRRFGTA
jgi:hypothetical protein